MSHTTIFVVRKDGEVEHYAHAKNAWGTAPLIWTEVAKVAGMKDPMLCWREGELEPFWALFNSGKLPEKLNWLFGFTFDKVWVQQASIPRLVKLLRWFDETYAVPQNRVRTCEEVADHLMRLLATRAKDDFRGVCFQMTSVSDCPWKVYVPGAEERRPYNFDKNTGHFELFSENPED